MIDSLSKPISFGPVFVPGAIAELLAMPTVSGGVNGVGTHIPNNPRFLVRHIRLSNVSASACTVSVYIQFSILFLAKTLAPGESYDWYGELDVSNSFGMAPVRAVCTDGGGFAPTSVVFACEGDLENRA